MIIIKKHTQPKTYFALIEILNTKKEREPDIPYLHSWLELNRNLAMEIS